MIGSYFCLIPHTDLAFVMVSKNAVTFLKRVALFNSGEPWPTGFRDTHDRIGYTAASEFLVPVLQMPTYEAEHGVRRKFAVWRDPVSRLESTYSLFVLDRKPHPYFEYLGLPEQPSWERFEDFLTFEWSKSHVQAVDEHVRRQVDYYGLADVDDVVALPRLHDYLAAHGVAHRVEQSNSSGAGFRVRDPDSLARIRAHYAADYDLIDRTAPQWT